MAKKPYIIHVFPAGYKPDANRLKSIYPNAYFYPVKSKDKKEAWEAGHKPYSNRHKKFTRTQTIETKDESSSQRTTVLQQLPKNYR